MPWYGWSISATTCQTGAKLAEVEGTTCSDCYALKGNYRWNVVKAAHERRLAALDHPNFVEAFALVLNTLLDRQRTKENRFRWFDSGDLQSVEMLAKIVEIARRTPRVRHWLPTREYKFVRYYLAFGGEIPDNLVIRMSHPWLGEEPRGRMLGLPFSTVGVEQRALTSIQCGAAEQGNKCLDCDACWRRVDINYRLH
ncbi:hypothetical protein CPT_Seuss78 [Caulobacter phage Seuss]|uniref:Gene product 88 domain-containing protein n=1 Tax=Caulobacter phage Seuss TaxID=1675601 RepID=A0A0K1LMB0_9CAUD|nr:hypothetical protein HOR08_gp078 [Caulobacter phage Seuss]AKU43604.1 hypothetical protein CPT_Seuss78 [Caulobacter phage Seuss]